MKSQFLLSALLLLASCTQQEESFILNPSSPHQITVSFSGFNITTSPLTRATETLPDNINRLSLKVFNADGDAVATVQQKRGEEGFGTASLTLAQGSYTFVCVLHEAKAGNATALAAIEAATINSATEAILPGIAARDTYCCTQSVQVTGSTTDITLAMGTRINARFKLTVTDQAPTTVRKVRIYINPEATDPTGSITLNPSTGLVATPLRFYGTKQLETTTVPDIEIDTYLPTVPYLTTVLLEGRNDANTTVLYTRTIDNVTFNPNQLTHATGRLFAPLTSTFSFTTTTWTTSDISF